MAANCVFSGFLQKPDITIADRIAVILKLDSSLAGVLSQLDLVMDGNTIVLDARDRRIAATGSLEFHVVGLPAKWRIAHVYVRALPLVESTALIGFSGEPE